MNYHQLHYDAFPQLENGIGMVRSFLDTWDTEKSRIKDLSNIGGRFGIVTGELAARFMEPIVAIGMQTTLTGL